MAGIAVLAACGPVKDLPAFKPAPDGWLKAYTPYDVPMAVPAIYQPRKGNRGPCGNRPSRNGPYRIGCEWGYELTSNAPGEFQLNFVTLYAFEGAVPDDLTALSDGFIRGIRPSKERGEILKDETSELMFHADARYPHFSRNVKIRYRNSTGGTERDVTAIQYLAPVPPTQAHGMVVQTFQRTEVQAGRNFVVGPEYDHIDFNALGGPRDVLFAIIDEMNHVQRPELFVTTVSGVSRLR